MQNRDFQSNYKENFLEWWSNITLVRKPIIAAVNGYALGGGCEVSPDIVGHRHCLRMLRCYEILEKAQARRGLYPGTADSVRV